MLLLSGTMLAQQSPKLLKMETDDAYLQFEYDAEGRIIKDKFAYTDGDGGTETRTNAYTYASDKIVQRYVEGDRHDTDTRTSIIENGRIVKETIVMSAEIQEHTQDVQTYIFTYNAVNQLVKIVDSSGHAENEKTYVVTWADGCPSNIKTYREGVLVGEVDFTYDTSVTNPYVIAMTNPFLQGFLDYEAIEPYGQLLGGYYGASVKYAVTGVKYTVHVARQYPWEAEDSFYFDYQKDAKGQVVSATQTDTEATAIRFVWEDSATGIHALATSTAADTYYQVNGMRQPTLRKGLNIVRSGNGTVRKVLHIN